MGVTLDSFSLLGTKIFIGKNGKNLWLDEKFVNKNAIILNLRGVMGSNSVINCACDNL